MLEMSSLNEDKPPPPPLRLSSQNQPATPKTQLHQLNHLSQLNQLSETTANLPVNFYLKNHNGPHPPLPQLPNQLLSSQQQLSNQLSNQLLNQYNSQFNNQSKLNSNNIPVNQKPLPKEPSESREADGKSHKKGASKHEKQSSKKGKSKADQFTSDKPVISPPTNFEHTFHVGFNAETGEFCGLPDTWATLLKISNISKLEQQRNPQAVIDVLKWYDLFSNEKFEGFGVQAPKYMNPNAGKSLSVLEELNKVTGCHLAYFKPFEI